MKDGVDKLNSKLGSTRVHTLSAYTQNNTQCKKMSGNLNHSKFCKTETEPKTEKVSFFANHTPLQKFLLNTMLANL